MRRNGIIVTTALAGRSSVTKKTTRRCDQKPQKLKQQHCGPYDSKTNYLPEPSQ